MNSGCVLIVAFCYNELIQNDTIIIFTNIYLLAVIIHLFIFNEFLQIR